MTGSDPANVLRRQGEFGSDLQAILIQMDDAELTNG